MPNCKLCGAALYKGNIKVVRPRGKKRPWRECRRCPKKTPDRLEALMRAEACESAVQIERIRNAPVGSFADEQSAGNGLQRPQDTTGGPFTVEGVFDYPPPPRYRFFLHPNSVLKLRKAIEKGDAWLYGFASNWSMGIALEIIPVLEEVAEANPEAVERFVEVEINLKDE